MDSQALSLWVLTLTMPETCFVLYIPHRLLWSHGAARAGESHQQPRRLEVHLSAGGLGAKLGGRLHQPYSQLWPMPCLEVW